MSLQRIKVFIYQEGIRILKLCAPNKMALKYVKQKFAELWGQRQFCNQDVLCLHFSGSVCYYKQSKKKTPTKNI